LLPPSWERCDSSRNRSGSLAKQDPLGEFLDDLFEVGSAGSIHPPGHLVQVRHSTDDDGQDSTGWNIRMAGGHPRADIPDEGTRLQRRLLVTVHSQKRQAADGE
jgi:hypothetical protein